MKHVLLHKAVDTYVSETSEVQEGVEVEVHVCTSECVTRVCARTYGAAGKASPRSRYEFTRLNFVQGRTEFLDSWKRNFMLNSRKVIMSGSWA